MVVWSDSSMWRWCGGGGGQRSGALAVSLLSSFTFAPLPRCHSTSGRLTCTPNLDAAAVCACDWRVVQTLIAFRC